MKQLKKAVALLPLFIAAGCATTQSTSDAQRESIEAAQRGKPFVYQSVQTPEQAGTRPSKSIAERKGFEGIGSVTIARNVVIPETPQVFGKDAAAGFFWGGPIIGAIVAQTATADSLEFKKFLHDHRIDLKEIIRHEFIASLTATQAFPAVVDDGGDAYFDLTIQNYGLGPGFSMAPIDKPLRPTLRLTAKPLTRDGKVLWENTESVTPLSNATPAYRIAVLYATPRLIEEGFTRVAQVLTKELLKDFGGR